MGVVLLLLIVVIGIITYLLFKPSEEGKNIAQVSEELVVDNELTDEIMESITESIERYTKDNMASDDIISNIDVYDVSYLTHKEDTIILKAHVLVVYQGDGLYEAEQSEVLTISYNAKNRTINVSDR